MPTHIEEMSSEMVVFEGDSPWAEALLDKLEERLLKRLADKQREAAQIREATALRRQAAPPSPIGE